MQTGEKKIWVCLGTSLLYLDALKITQCVLYLPSWLSQGTCMYS